MTAGDVSIYRAVGLNEAVDVERVGGFRPKPGADFEAGKWFATTYADAVRWGEAMQVLDGLAARPFRVAEAMVSGPFIVMLAFWARHDGIGPAYFVRSDQLALMNAGGRIVVHPTTYQPG